MQADAWRHVDAKEHDAPTKSSVGDPKVDNSLLRHIGSVASSCGAHAWTGHHPRVAPDR